MSKVTPIRAPVAIKEIINTTVNANGFKNARELFEIIVNLAMEVEPWYQGDWSWVIYTKAKVKPFDKETQVNINLSDQVTDFIRSFSEKDHISGNSFMLTMLIWFIREHSINVDAIMDVNEKNNNVLGWVSRTLRLCDTPTISEEEGDITILNLNIAMDKSDAKKALKNVGINSAAELSRSCLTLRQAQIIIEKAMGATS